MSKRIKTKIGDVFLIPLAENRFGIGQVSASWEGELYIVIFETVYTSTQVNADEILGKRPILAALSLDALIWNGQWPIIGSITSNLSDLPHPTYKVNEGHIVFVESRDRLTSRPATSEEERILKFRTVVAPIRLENALKAYHGIGEWQPRFDELNFLYALESSKLL
jgi:hypothetical protein